MCPSVAMCLPQRVGEHSHKNALVVLWERYTQRQQVSGVRLRRHLTTSPGHGNTRSQFTKATQTRNRHSLSRYEPTPPYVLQHTICSLFVHHSHSAVQRTCCYCPAAIGSARTRRQQTCPAIRISAVTLHRTWRYLCPQTPCLPPVNNAGGRPPHRDFSGLGAKSERDKTSQHTCCLMEPPPHPGSSSFVVCTPYSTTTPLFFVGIYGSFQPVGGL